jgi:hypothetical protein
MTPPRPKGDTLADWQGWWFDLGCCQNVFMPVRLLLMEGWKPEQKMADIAARFRCRECGHRPGSICMTSNPASGTTANLGPRIQEEVPGMPRTARVRAVQP